MDSLGQSLQAYQKSLEIRSTNHRTGIEDATLDARSGPSNEDFSPKLKQDTEVLGRTLLPLPTRGFVSEPKVLLGGSETLTKNGELNFLTRINPEWQTRCQCQKGGFRTLGLLSGILGTLLIEWTGQILGNRGCGDEDCTSCASPTLTITYYGPSWIIDVATRFTLRLSPPTFSLSFPRIRPPDAEIFIGIRAGNVEYVKSLLIEGRGSVADVMAPYGFSTLLLAIIHQQLEIFHLLLSAGASRAPQIHLDCSASHMEQFWTDYNSKDYEILATDVLRDYTYQLGSLPYSQLFSTRGRGSIETTFWDYQSLTRLHKCTIGLTSETLEDALAFSCGELDVPDSLGRTALHFAAYQCNVQAMQFLLKNGADPNLTDHYGKAPLHIAAGLGSIPLITALTAAGPDLEIRDQFENTPIHLACLMGHVRTVELLLNAGADIEALNAHGETPVRQAILNDRIETAQLLHQRGAAFSGSIIYACAGNPMNKAVWFNSHRVIRFLLGLHTRVDQKHKSGKTILHTLADNGDCLTMRIFLEATHPSLARLDVDELDSRGWTAMDYLKSRKNAEELIEPFLKVVEHVQRARTIRSAGSSEIFSPAEEATLRVEDEVFFDAVEIQDRV